MQPAGDSVFSRSAGGRGNDAAPLVAHIIFRLAIGGLENGVVNLINTMPASEFRHAVICLTDFTEFRQRIRRSDVEVFALHKPPGNSPAVYASLWALLRRLKPQIVHTRNLGTVDCQVAALAAGVRARIHSEHGRDLNDLDGRNRRHLAIRRAMRPFVHHYIALSKDLERYLLGPVGVRRERLSQIYNGVDTQRFRPRAPGDTVLPELQRTSPDQILIGTVGRMEPVKDPVTLARAFVAVANANPTLRPRLRLVIVGHGSVAGNVAAYLHQASLLDQAWLPGARNDVPEIMRQLDIFVLPSRSEGISNTILEAMATGLPIVATTVGGNPELVADGGSGILVPPADPEATAAAIFRYAADANLRARHAQHARAVALDRFSLTGMVSRYGEIYRQVLNRRRPAPAVPAPTDFEVRR